ncbi:MAG: alpha-amylase, partial [Akkermansiaceae bacterium]|nr:alpha-amylase [Verrucomicrobiales bacterium]
MPLTYEINTRCWLRELSERTHQRITLSDVPEAEFQEWQRLGFTRIWLMGVWSSGSRSRALALSVADLQLSYGCPLQKIQRTDIAGSPYAISEYRVPKALGGEAGLRTFRKKLHEFGIRLLLD